MVKNGLYYLLSLGTGTAMTTTAQNCVTVFYKYVTKNSNHKDSSKYNFYVENYQALLIEIKEGKKN